MSANERLLRGAKVHVSFTATVTVSQAESESNILYLRMWKESSYSSSSQREYGKVTLFLNEMPDLVVDLISNGPHQCDCDKCPVRGEE